MNQSPDQSNFRNLLDPDETVLWQGPIRFKFFSAPLFTVALMAVTVFTIWALDGYVPSQSSGSRRAQFGHVAVRPALIVLLFFQILAMLERRAVTSGRAKGEIILTHRRLLRICDWPKLRVRSYQYLSKRVSGFSGIVWVGEFGWVNLAPSNAAHLLRLMKVEKSEAQI